MRIEEKIIIRFTPEEIQELITKHLESEGYDVERVKLNVDRKREGYSMDSFDVHYFSGAVCDAKKKC